MLGWAQRGSIGQRVEQLLKQMTLVEKVGQLNQYSGDWSHTGPVTMDPEKKQQIRDGKLGSMLNVVGVKHTRELQELAMQSRLKIPLLFGQDVIHGFRTTFPLPLAEAASWDLEAMQAGARVAAKEASAWGIHWTFAPMVDIARDPRWGRVMEGAGEDPYLGSRIAEARVRGFQGKQIGAVDRVLACAKHFAAYGAAVGGRDYNSVDMSLQQLWEIYLPPFLASVKAGVATFMNSFNDLNGIPATGNRYLQRDILKGQWKFPGFVVSDWGSIGEMINHGTAANSQEAALSAILAGSDMDMESRAYRDNLAQLVQEGKVPIRLVDDAVRRILTKKFELGLFDDPYRFSDSVREASVWDNAEHKAVARDMAKKSIVLLKNDTISSSSQPALPLATNVRYALIGPHWRSVRDHLGFWSSDWPDDSIRIKTNERALMERLPASSILGYARGCAVDDSSTTGFAEALELAAQADVILLNLGERRDMSGEAKSRSNIHLPGVQEALFNALHKTGKPIVVILHAGRPMVFPSIAQHAHAIVYAWWLGLEAGPALADVLTGGYNPSGRLPMTFPRSEGQIPIYYNYLNTGRPAQSDDHVFYVSAYNDLPNSPQYAFGHGLSYTKFTYSNLRLLDTLMIGQGKIRVQLDLTNSGSMAGTETIQLYIRDRVASLSRPMKQLKDFQQVNLKPNETKTISFTVDREKLSFYNEQLKWVAEPGDFDIMIGASARDIRFTKVIRLVR
jgi:beta-glucosidase